MKFRLIGSKQDQRLLFTVGILMNFFQFRKTTKKKYAAIHHVPILIEVYNF